MNANATVFTFTIKKGVMFGPPVNREVTAQDFVDSWTYNAEAQNQSATVYILTPIKGIDPNTGYVGKGGLSGVVVTGKYTLQVTLKYPFADFPATLVHPITHVFPVDYAKKVGRKAYFSKPVGGTGPYMVQEWKHNRSVTLVKNPSYWNTSGSGNSASPGHVDTIFMPIYTDTTTVWLAFQKGTTDFSPYSSRQRPRGREQCERQERHLDREVVSKHLRVLHQHRHEQPAAGWSRPGCEPAPSRRSQLCGRPGRRLQHRDRRRVHPLGRDRAGEHPGLRAGS